MGIGGLPYNFIMGELIETEHDSFTLPNLESLDLEVQSIFLFLAVVEGSYCKRNNSVVKTGVYSLRAAEKTI